MTKNDKTYGVRISVDLGNAITLELKGAGRAHIIPNKDYYFENAPIEFINYITQLRKLGLTYKITPDKKGCFQTYDLKNYTAVPNLLFRGGTIIPVSPVEEKNTHVIAKPEDTIKVDIPVVIENIPEDKPEVKEENKTEDKDEPKQEVEDKTEEIPEVKENTEEPKVYTEDELMYYSKKELLAVASEKNLPMSEINTKKEIRQAILDSQN